MEVFSSSRGQGRQAHKQYQLYTHNALSHHSLLQQHTQIIGSTAHSNLKYLLFHNWSIPSIQHQSIHAIHEILISTFIYCNKHIRKKTNEKGTLFSSSQSYTTKKGRGRHCNITKHTNIMTSHLITCIFCVCYFAVTNASSSRGKQLYINAEVMILP